MFINQLHLPKSHYFWKLLSREISRLISHLNTKICSIKTTLKKTSVEQMLEITHSLFLYILWDNKKMSWPFLEKEIYLPKMVLVHLQIHKGCNCSWPKVFPPTTPHRVGFNCLTPYIPTYAFCLYLAAIKSSSLLDLIW